MLPHDKTALDKLTTTVWSYNESTNGFPFEPTTLAHVIVVL